MQGTWTVQFAILYQRLFAAFRAESIAKTPSNIRTLGGALFCDRR